MRLRTARAVVTVSARMAVTTGGRPGDAREVEDATAHLVVETGRPRAITASEDSVNCTVVARRLRGGGKEDEDRDPRDAVPDLWREAVDAKLVVVSTEPGASRVTELVLARCRTFCSASRKVHEKKEQGETGLAFPPWLHNLDGVAV